MSSRQIAMKKFLSFMSDGQRLLEEAGVNWQNSTTELPWEFEAEKKEEI